MTGPDSGPRVVRVEAPRVEGTIPLEDIARRLQAAARDAAGGPHVQTIAARTGAAPSGDQRLARLSELAGQLADELAALPDGLLAAAPPEEPRGRPT